MLATPDVAKAEVVMGADPAATTSMSFSSLLLPPMALSPSALMMATMAAPASPGLFRTLSVSSLLNGSSGTPTFGGRFSPMCVAAALDTAAAPAFASSSSTFSTTATINNNNNVPFDSLAASANAGDFFASFFANPDQFTGAEAAVASAGASAAADMLADVVVPAPDFLDFAAAVNSVDVPELPLLSFVGVVGGEDESAAALMDEGDEDAVDDDDETFNVFEAAVASTKASKGASRRRVVTSAASCNSSTGDKRKRRAKVPVAEDVKATEAYKERRRKNNLAAARNREMKRQQARAETDLLPALDARKLELSDECALLRAELNKLKARLFERFHAMA